MAGLKQIRTRSTLLFLLAAFFAGALSAANAQQDDEPKAAAAAKRERLTLKDLKIEGGALIVTGSTGLPSRRVTILNSPEPRIAVTSDRKGDFTIRRTDFRPDDCKLTIGVVSGTQRALVANCGPKGDAAPRGTAGPAGPQGIAGPTGPQGDKGDPGAVGPSGATGSSGVVTTASVVNKTGSVTTSTAGTPVCQIDVDLSQVPGGSYKVVVAANAAAVGSGGVLAQTAVALVRRSSAASTPVELTRTYITWETSSISPLTAAINFVDTVSGPGVYSYTLTGFATFSQMYFRLFDSPCYLTAFAVRA